MSSYSQGIILAGGFPVFWFIGLALWSNAAGALLLRLVLVLERWFCVWFWFIAAGAASGAGALESLSLGRNRYGFNWKSLPWAAQGKDFYENTLGFK